MTEVVTVKEKNRKCILLNSALISVFEIKFSYLTEYGKFSDCVLQTNENT